MLKVLPEVEAQHLGDMSKPLVLSLSFLIWTVGITVVPVSNQIVHVKHLSGVRWAFHKYTLNMLH